ncbi:MAG: hypothetical protein ACREBU_19210 [Nitrososphaera sp.]
MLVQAILIGIVLGALELAILASSKQKLGVWVYAQSIVFWFTCGFMIGIVDSPLPPYATGAMIAVFLNLPWYINISIIPKQYGHFVPLVVASIVLGIIGGFVKMLLSTLF